MGNPTPDSISPSTSSSSLLPDGNQDDDYSSDNTSPSTGSSSPRVRSRSPVPRRTLAPPGPNGLLAPPNLMQSAWRNISRSPSPMGLIPIHRTFSSLIHKHEVPRKILHVSIGFLVLHLYRNGHQPIAIVPPLATLLVPIASADILRFYSPEFNRLYIKALGALMRESEVRGWNGVVWYLVGTITVLSIFPKDIATLSVLLLSWCDTAASTFGRAWGRYTPRIRRGKSLAGSFAAFLVGVISAGIFWGYIVPSTPRWPDDPVNAVMWGERLAIGGSGVEVTGSWALGVMSVLTGFIASASEVVDCFGLDDNVVIPVLSAIGIWGVLKVLG